MFIGKMLKAMVESVFYPLKSCFKLEARKLCQGGSSGHKALGFRCNSL